MDYAHEVLIPLAPERINLPDWLFTLSEEDYARCQRGHGVIGAERRTGMINVESIGGSLLIQHYATRLAEPHHVTMVSRASRAYLMHLAPVRCGVEWTMRVTACGAGSLFRCSIAVDLPAAVRVIGLFSATPFFVRRHLVEETRGFARDIARKVDPRLAQAEVRDVAAARH